MWRERRERVGVGEKAGYTEKYIFSGFSLDFLTGTFCTVSVFPGAFYQPTVEASMQELHF